MLKNLLNTFLLSIACYEKTWYTDAAVDKIKTLLIRNGDNMIKGKIILLNGVSSSGKSTLARELSKHLPDYFVLGLDDIGSLLLKMRNDKKEPSTWSIIKHPNYQIHYKTYLFHRLIKSISEYSFNIIVDTVFDCEEDRNDFMDLFKNEDILYVGVYCPLFELERRELDRGDRNIGIAKEQYGIVHKNMIYDIEVDTYKNTIEECAQKTLNKLL